MKNNRQGFRPLNSEECSLISKVGGHMLDSTVGVGPIEFVETFPGEIEQYMEDFFGKGHEARHENTLVLTTVDDRNPDFTQVIIVSLDSRRIRVGSSKRNAVGRWVPAGQSEDGTPLREYFPGDDYDPKIGAMVAFGRAVRNAPFELPEGLFDNFYAVNQKIEVGNPGPSTTVNGKVEVFHARTKAELLKKLEEAGVFKSFEKDFGGGPFGGGSPFDPPIGFGISLEELLDSMVERGNPLEGFSRSGGLDFPPFGMPTFPLSSYGVPPLGISSPQDGNDFEDRLSKINESRTKKGRPTVGVEDVIEMADILTAYSKSETLLSEGKGLEAYELLKKTHDRAVTLVTKTGDTDLAARLSSIPLPPREFFAMQDETRGLNLDLDEIDRLGGHGPFDFLELVKNHGGSPTPGDGSEVGRGPTSSFDSAQTANGGRHPLSDTVTSGDGSNVLGNLEGFNGPFSNYPEDKPETWPVSPYTPPSEVLRPDTVIHLDTPPPTQQGGSNALAEAEATGVNMKENEYDGQVESIISNMDVTVQVHEETTTKTTVAVEEDDDDDLHPQELSRFDGESPTTARPTIDPKYVEKSKKGERFASSPGEKDWRLPNFGRGLSGFDSEIYPRTNRHSGC